MCEVLKPPEVTHTTSRKLQWLPSDFAIAEDGTVTLASPYINNVHPQKHAALESVIPKLFEREIPLWERVLSDTPRPLLPFGTKSEIERSLPSCLSGATDEAYQDDEDYGNRRAWLSK